MSWHALVPFLGEPPVHETAAMPVGLPGVRSLAAAASAQTLRIYNIDVEQADSALLVLPNGKTLLIDSGENGHGQRVKDVMDLGGVSKIDAFVASHYHEDHYGGIDELVDMGVEVLEAFDRGDKQFLTAATRAQATYKGYLVGDAGSFIDPLSSAGVQKALASA